MWVKRYLFLTWNIAIRSLVQWDILLCISRWDEEPILIGKKSWQGKQYEGSHDVIDIYSVEEGSERNK